MSENIQFEEENKFKSKQDFGKPVKNGLTKWLQEKGVVKDEKTAHYVLLSLMVIFFLAAGIIFATQIGSDTSNLTESERENLRTNFQENRIRNR